MHPPRPALSGPFHVFLHGLIVVMGWGIFGWCWWTVGFEQPLRATVLTTLILITLLIAPLMTLFWVAHNRDLYVRKGQRRGMRSAAEIYQNDWAGRRVHAQFGTLRHSSLVIINSTPDDKYFLTPLEILSKKLSKNRKPDAVYA